LSSFSTLYLIDPDVPPRNAALMVKHGPFSVDSRNRRKWVGCSLVSPLKGSTLIMSLHQLKVKTFNLHQNYQNILYPQMNSRYCSFNWSPHMLRNTHWYRYLT
jgi:hypothetical protein